MANKLEMQILLTMMVDEAVISAKQVAQAIKGVKVSAQDTDKAVKTASASIVKSEKQLQSAARETERAEARAAAAAKRAAADREQASRRAAAAMANERREAERLFQVFARNARSSRNSSADRYAAPYGSAWHGSAQQSADAFRQHYLAPMLAREEEGRRAAQRAASGQAFWNSWAGVGSGSGKSARDSASVFKSGFATQAESDAKLRMLRAHEDRQRVAQEREQKRNARMEAERRANASREQWQQALGVTTTGLAVSMGLASAGDFAINSVLKPALDAAGKFESRMVDIGFIIGDYTGTKFKEASKHIKQFSMDSTWSLRQTQDAIYQLLSAGLQLRDAQAVLPSTYAFSLFTGGRQSTESINKMFTSVYNKFSPTTGYLKNAGLGKAYSIIGDQLAKMVNISKFDPEEVAPFVNSLGMAPTRYNIPLHTVLGMGAMIKQFGNQPAESGEFVNILFRRTAEIEKMYKRGQAGGDITKFLGSLNPSQPEYLQRAMKAMARDGTGGKGKGRGTIAAKTIYGMMSMLDINPFDETKKGRPMKDGLEFVTDVVGKLDKYNDELGKTVIMNTLFGEIGGQVLAMVKNFHLEVERGGKIVTLYGAQALKEYTRQIKESGGELEKFKREVFETWEKTIDRFNNSLTALATSMGATWKPLVQPFIEALTTLLNKASTFADKYPVIGHGIGMLLIGFGSLAVVLGKVGTAFFGFTSALGLTYYFTRQVAGEVGMFRGILILLRKSFEPLINTILKPFGMSLSAVGWILKGTLIGALIMAVLYITNLGGAAEWVNEKLRATKLIFHALREYFSTGQNKGSTLMALLGVDENGQQKYANVLGIYEDILYVVQILKVAWLGLKMGVDDFLQAVNPAAKSIGKLLGIVLNIAAVALGVFFPGVRKGSSSLETFTNIVYGLTRVFLGPLEMFARLVGVIADVVSYVSQINGVAQALQAVATALTAIWLARFGMRVLRGAAKVGGKAVGVGGADAVGGSGILGTIASFALWDVVVKMFSTAFKFFLANGLRGGLRMMFGTVARFFVTTVIGGLATFFTVTVPMFFKGLLVPVLSSLGESLGVGALTGGLWGAIGSLFIWIGTYIIAPFVTGLSIGIGLVAQCGDVFGRLMLGFRGLWIDFQHALPSWMGGTTDKEYAEKQKAFYKDIGEFDQRNEERKARYDKYGALAGWRQDLYSSGFTTLGKSQGDYDRDNQLKNTRGSGIATDSKGNIIDMAKGTKTSPDGKVTSIRTARTKEELSALHQRSAVGGEAPGASIGHISNQFTFNVDKPLSEAQLRQIINWIRDHADEFGAATVGRQ